MARTSTKKTAANKAKSLAFDAGIDAFRKQQTEKDCPYSDGPLREGWIGGWQAESARQEKTDPEDKLKIPFVEEKTNGHKFNDPEVKKHEDDMKTVLRDMDDAGVCMSEEQFRTLDDSQREWARRWGHGRKRGVLSLVPDFLRPYVQNKQLLREIASYENDQMDGRRMIFPIKFGKPSPTKPEGDPEQQIRVTFLVPVEDVKPIEANMTWGWVRNRIEFGRRDKNSWDQQEFSECSETISCVADVSGYARTRTHWKVSFLVDHRQLSSIEANRLWGQQGSARMEPIGSPEMDERADTENPEREKKEEKSLPNLFDDVVSSHARVIENGEFQTPDEYYVPSDVDQFSAMFSIGQGENNRIYVSGWMSFFNSEETTIEYDGESPKPIGDGFSSIKAAVEKELGSMIEFALSEKATENVMTCLRNHLKHLTDGGEPIQCSDD